MTQGRDLVPAEAIPAAPSRVQKRSRRGPGPQATLRNLPAPAPAGGFHHRSGRGDFEFSPRALDILEVPPSPLRGWVILVVAAMFATAFAWGYFGRIASYTAAPGKIQTSGRTKVLEAVSKGQVTKILVRDGDEVKEEEILVELDPTEATAARAIIDQNLTALRAESLRRETEIPAARSSQIDSKVKVPWPDDVPKAVRSREDDVLESELSKLASQLATLASQKHAKEVERDKYVKLIEAQKALVGVTQENLSMIDELQKKGYNSKAKYLDFKATLDQQQVALTGYEGSLANAKQMILTIDSEIAKTREVFVTANTKAAAAAAQTISDLTQQLVRADQTLANMTLRCPSDGVVHAMAVTTVGQVVKPGQQLMQIVPRSAPLEIQAYVPNTEIGFIRVGDDATVKVNTFAFGTYGSIRGSVVSIDKSALPTPGKDTVQSASLDGVYRSTTTAQRTGNLQFAVTVRTERSTMTIEGKEVPLVPGMGVVVEIQTENRRAIDYLVSPVVNLLSTAVHEK